MGDRELLELACKAVGGKVHEPSFIDFPKKFTVSGFSGWFNPLESNDHALRLANHLCMSVSTGPCTARATTIAGALRGAFFEEDTCHQDRDEAVRRVIVRCAAEVGEAKP